MTCQTLPRQFGTADLIALHEQARRRAVQLRRQAFADALDFAVALPARAWRWLGHRAGSRQSRPPNLPQA